MKKAIKISAVLVALVVLFAMAFVFTSSAAEKTVNSADELIEAIANQAEKTTIKLGTDITLDAAAIVNVGSEITLDLNGHKLTSATTGALFTQTGVVNPKEFVITDSQGKGAIIAAAATLLGDNFGGTVKIEGGTIIAAKGFDATNGKKVTLTIAQSETYKTGTWTSFDPNDSTVLGFKGYETTTPNTELLEGKTPADAAAKYYVRPELYTITYVVPENADNTTNATTNATFTIWDNVQLAAATADGYEFKGWFVTDNEGEKQITAIAAGTEFHSLVLVGKFETETYTITYAGVDGATHNNQGTFTVELPNLKLTDATKKGYTFEGWYTEANGQGTRVTEIECSKTYENVTVYAHFTPIVYTITYVTYGGAPVAGQTLVGTYTIEEELTFATLEKAGYDFTAWYTVVEPTADDAPKAGITKGETGNITVYAQYTVKEYKIEYETDASIDEELTAANGFKDKFTVETPTFTLKAPKVKPGFEFKGWKDETGKIISAVTVGTIGDLKLTPVITPIEYKIFYNFGTGVQFSEVNNDANAITWSTFFGGQSPALVAATRTHYNFVGWSYTNPETEEAKFLAYDEATKTWTIPNTTYENVTVYAVWEKANYKIDYDIDGYKYKILVDDKGVPVLNPTTEDVQYVDKDGKVVDNKNEMVKVTKDFGASVAEIAADAPTTYTYFDAVTIPTPTRPGYTFVRWYEEVKGVYLEPDANGVVTIDAGSRSGDIKLVAEWEVAKYNLTIKYQFNDDYYNVNKELLVSKGWQDEGRTFYVPVLNKKVVYGTDFEHEVLFRIQDGFVPADWYVKGTMGAEDTTLIVYFEPIVMSTEFENNKLVITYHDGSQKVIDVEKVTGVKYVDGKVVYVDENGTSTVVAVSHADLSKAIEDLKLDELKGKVDANATEIQKLLAELPTLVKKADFDALNATVTELQAQIDAVTGKATTNLVLIIIIGVIAVAAAAGAGYAVFGKKN